MIFFSEVLGAADVSAQVKLIPAVLSPRPLIQSQDDLNGVRRIGLR